MRTVVRRAQTLPETARRHRRTDPPTEHPQEGRKAKKGSKLMDPNTTLENMRAAVASLNSRLGGDPDYVDDLIDIAEHAQVLDDWISRGGFLPTAWSPTAV